MLLHGRNESQLQQQTEYKTQTRKSGVVEVVWGS